ncbi:autotransporter-associated beta strand repeat-containing protein [Ancylobacter sp. FA202]|uniref:autotransporter-associated beta strand repeat-containing protein n=1 Tax=Ancylobacter sp. FA202 TaxID=1111106 RepID=UPI000381071C|nr:autotransporter-associated beta strand repeat-containing protein [Ancylobacter sp. FA202]
MRRPRQSTASLRAALLASAALLTAAPALGQSINGATNPTGPGGNGLPYIEVPPGGGGGGGGGGTTGGLGAAGNSPQWFTDNGDGGTPGLPDLSPVFLDGGDGGDGHLGGSGGGGGGGAHAYVGTSAPDTVVVGGDGGDGGEGGEFNTDFEGVAGGGGGPGAGGYGAVIELQGSPTPIALQYDVIGGDGGDGGSGASFTYDGGDFPVLLQGGAGNGGDAGVGVYLYGSGGTVEVLSSVNGGDGGMGGHGLLPTFGGIGGDGLVMAGSSTNVIIDAGQVITGGDGGISLSGTSGVGGYGILILGDNNVLTLFGTASGGIQGGNPASQSAGIAITGNGNTLVLTQSYAANGGVSVSGDFNILALGGNAGDSGGVFDAGSIGTSFSGFSQYEVIDDTSWTLTGESYSWASWDIQDGALSIDDPLSLDPTSELLISNSGQLTTTASMAINLPIDLYGGSGPGATFDVETGTVLILGGEIQGPGNLIVTGGGMLALDASNAYTGTTTVLQGTLSVAGAFPLGEMPGTLSLADGTMLEFAFQGDGPATNLTGAVTLAGNVTIFSPDATTGQISGNISDGSSSGGLTLSGQGTVLLSGANSFTGAVTVADGTLIAGSATALGSNGTVTVQEGATLQLNTSIATGSLAGAGAVIIGTNTLTVGANNASSSFSGNFSGTGGLTKTGSGTLTLQGVDADVSVLTIAGGTLVLDSQSVLGSGTVVAFSGGVSSTLQLNSNQTVAGLTGDGSLSLGSSTITVAAANDFTFAGAITGDGGSLVKAGTGTLTLSGSNSFTGPTLISGGTLVLAGGAALSDLTAVTVGSGTQLQLQASETIGGLAGSGMVTLAGTTLSLGGNGADTGFSGSISNGSLVKQGAGTTVLTGTYDLSALTIAAGIVQIGDGVSATTFQAAPIVNNGTLVLTPAQELVLADVISGSGAVTINAGNAPVTFNASNTYTGGTTITAGTLNLGSGAVAGAIAGDIVNNGTLAFNSSASPSFGGAISGTGGVSAIGGGVVTLSGANTYAGGTAISNGSTVSIGSDGNLGAGDGGISLANGTLAATGSFSSAREVVLGGAGGIDVASGQTLTLSGAIGETSTSQLTKSGDGVLVLSGANSYTGGTLVSGGTVAVSADSNLGAAIGGLTLDGGKLITTASFTSARNVTLGSGNGTFDVAPGTVLTLAGAFSGSGGLTKIGAGELALSGASSFTGGTSVTSGTLALYGATLATSSVSVADSGTLQGFGTIAGTVSVLAGGTLAGGVTGQPNPQHIALVTGSLTLANAADIALALGAAGNTGVAEVTGDLALGGTLSVSGEAVHGAGIYRVFTYTGTNSGSFASVDLSGLVDSASYTGTIETGNPGHVNLLLRDASPLQIWTTDNGTSFGGSGTWSSTGDTWYLASSGDTIPWGGQTGVFTGTAGTVTIHGEQTFQKLEFVTDGYVLQADGTEPASSLHVDGGGVLWVEGHDVTATISAPISGTGGIEKIGTGTLILTGSNSYVGGTKVSGGFLSVASASALGDAGNVLTLSDGGLATTGSFTLGSAVVLEGFGSLKTASGETLGLSGTISGTGSLRKEGLGTLVLSGSNTYGGATVIAEGTLEAQGGAALPDASAVRIEAAGTLQLDANEGIGSLAGSGAVNLQSYTLQVGYDASSSTFSGTITGTGGLVKQGVGTLVLTGTNVYSGGTTLAAGGIVVGNGGTSGSIAGNVTNNGSLSFYRSDVITFAGGISGTGGVAQVGSGTLVLSGTNSYAGGTLVSVGTLEVSADANLGQVSGPLVIEKGTLATTASFTTSRAVGLVGGGTLNVATGTTLQLTSAVSGDGGLTKRDDGTLILAADNNYEGTTTIHSGVLQLGNGGTTGSIRGAIVNDATLAFNRSDDFGFSNHVSGQGTVVQAGTGTLVVTGDVDAIGGVRIDQGTVQIGNGGTTGRISGPIVDNGTLVFARSDETRFDNVISGSGSVVQVGPGALILMGDNSYAGGTGIGAGSAIHVTADSALGALSGGITLAGGTLAAEQGFASARTVALVGGGTIRVADAAVFTLSGVLGGTGDFTKSGLGTLVLTGSNGYGGNTVVEAGTLQVGDGGTSGTISGNVANAGTLVFNRSDNIVYAGAISGAGTLVQAGTGALVLTGTGSYTGGTRIAAGTLVLGNGGTSGAITGNVVNDGTLAFNRADAVTFGGVISGSGTVAQYGAGTLTLTGANTYAGGTSVGSGATLQVASDGNLGAAAGSLTLAGGVLAPTASFASARAVTLTGSGGFSVGTGITLTLTGRVGGDGGLLLAGGGTLELGGINTYAGGTSVSGATLAVHADESLGKAGTALSLDGAALKVLHSFSTARDVALSAAGAVIEVTGDRFLAVSGRVTGTGVLTKTGEGRLTLNGANAYGGLIIHAGTVVGTTASIRGDVLDNGALVFDQSAAGTFADDIGGTGSLTVKGVGKLVVTGTAFHTGGTTIDSGTLQIGDGGTAGWVSGPIVNSGTLIYDLAGRYTFPVDLSGTGQVILEGGGTVDFVGSTYAGLIQTKDAHVILKRDTETDANFSIGARGVLSGTGSIGLLDVLDGGTVSPGYSPGTLEINGKMTLSSGSTYRADITAGNGNDLIAVNGEVGIDAGTTLDVHAERGSYANYTSYTVLTATEGVHGVFGTVTTNFAFLDILPDYEDDAVILNIVRKDIPFWREAHTFNQFSTANGIESLGAGNEVYDAVASQLKSEAFLAFDALSGEIYATTASVIQQQSVFTREAVIDRLRQASVGTNGAPLAYAANGPQTAGFGADVAAVMWMQGFGAQGDIASNGNAAAVSDTIGGFVGGFDAAFTEDWRLGAYGGYSRSWFDVSDRVSSGSMDNYELGLYSATQLGALALRLGAGYAWHDMSMSRTVAFAGYDGTNSSDVTASSAQVFGELGYGLSVGPVDLEPFIGLAYLHLDGWNTAEIGSTSALAVNAGAMDTLYSTLGLRGGRDIEVNGVAFTTSFTLGWQHAFGDTVPAAVMSFASGSAPFTIDGAPIATDTFVFGGGLSYEVDPNTRLGVKYDGQLASSAQQSVVSGQLQVRF